jgi:hypothetical protein
VKQKREIAFARRKKQKKKPKRLHHHYKLHRFHLHPIRPKRNHSQSHLSLSRSEIMIKTPLSQKKSHS